MVENIRARVPRLMWSIIRNICTLTYKPEHKKLNYVVGKESKSINLISASIFPTV